MLLTLLQIRVIVFNLLYLLACGYAIGRGGSAERWMVVILTVGRVAAWFAISPIVHRFEDAEVGVAIVDGLAFSAMLALALRADRFWPIWVASMQAVVMLMHMAMILKPIPFPAYYKNATQLWIYPQLAALALGTLRYRLRTDAAAWETALHRLTRHIVPGPLRRRMPIHAGRVAADDRPAAASR